ncbi:DUF2946 domain-containing protein [Roseateles sp. SL47]|uniref:DUF2946 domain-containing protein n=1 Tax=Roseateles sp. SL47 TaxID=2995138 RepID=UPI002271B4B7|nr:DUF2946 domain-containing protein [Roseateles sp. SL47]WAC73091.1 DUF2946 domain-containing protein [Roseateles sp. SL47]
MLHLRRKNAFTAWMASLAILWAALAPSLSWAFVPDMKGAWVEVCSVTGAKLVRVGTDGQLPDSPKASGMKGCSYCASHVPDLGLPPAPDAGLPARLLADPLPPLFLSAARTLFAWAAVQARAPPLNA